MKNYYKIIGNYFFQNKIQKSENENRITILRNKKKSDYERWSKPNSLQKNWNERIKILATFLPENAIILEFGAGAMYLKQLLNENQKYTPSDLVKRFPETIVCDLNQPIGIDLTQFDTVIFSGVLEYVYNIELLINQLESSKIKNIILSYACSDIIKVSREKNGWLSDYTKGELEKIFNKYNYRIIEYTLWNNQSLFQLKRTNVH